MSGWLCGCTANPHPLYACPGVPKAEAKPSTKSDLVAREVTGHDTGCRCASCWAIRTGFDIGYASGMSSGVSSGRAQAAADIRAHGEGWKHSPNVSYHSLEVLRTAARIAEADQSDAPKLQSDGLASPETPES